MSVGFLINNHFLRIGTYLLDPIQIPFIATFCNRGNANSMNRPITLYYAATIVFVLIDYGLGINLRIAFLELYPLMRVAYYAVCFGCLALMIWHPRWATLISGTESLLALSALTVSMMLRVMIVSDEIIEQGTGFVSVEEIINYLIVGSIAYLSWIRGIGSLKEPKINKRVDW